MDAFEREDGRRVEERKMVVVKTTEGNCPQGRIYKGKRGGRKGVGKGQSD